MNKFRQDLLYRINTVEINLPPLRERFEDIQLLAEHFLKIYVKKYRKSIRRIQSSALTKLQKYQWPGNVRELQHAIERAVIMSDSDVLQPSDFFFSTSNKDIESMAFKNLDLEEAEKAIIRKAINKNVGNMTQAAKELGLTRMSLYRRMKKYGL